MKEEELNLHFADGLLSIFINLSTEGTKYLVFYNHQKLEQNFDEENNENNENSAPTASSNESRNFATPSPKRVKLDYDAFINNLMYLIRFQLFTNLLYQIFMS